MSQRTGYDFSRVTPRAAPQRLLSIEEIEAAALDGPVPAGDTSLDVAPETPVEMELGPDRLVQAADAAFLNDLDARGEPPLPTPDGAGDQRLEISDLRGDEPLPPVVPPDYDFSRVTPRTSEPLVPTLAPEPGAGYDFSAVTAVRQPDPEAKPLSLSFGGQEGAIARAVRGPAKPEPVRTDARARDDADVTFDPEGKAFKFTGLELVPDTGVMATDPLKRRPQLAPGGEVVFDATRFSQGITEARNEGLLSEEQFDRLTVQADFAEKVLEQRRKLEAKAGENPELAAALYGFGRGGAATTGAVAGAKAGAAVGLAGGPLAKFTVPAGAIVGAIGGGIAGTVGYDAVYKQLAKHFEEYESVLAAAELRPGYAAGGQLATVALALPVSGVQAARGLRTAYEAGGMAQVARTGGAAAGTGAATGAIAAPIDAAVRGEAITPGTVATGAALGAAMGGFFIQGRKVGTAEVAQIFRKAEAGVKLTASEDAIFRSAYGPLQSAVRRGQMDGQRMTDIAVEVPQSSVMGFAPATGRARVEARYFAPARLPEGALRAARAAAAARAEAGVPAGQTLPSAAPAASGVIRTAPVNVLPSGTTPIVIPPPRSPAMLSPDEYAMTMGAERGLDMDFNPEATEALFAEHFELVKAAVSNNEPVSAAALDLYEMRVPYYVRDAETGVARFDEAAFADYEAYMTGRGREFREEMTEAGGQELLAAVMELGGLPSRQAGDRRGVWTGELESLLQTAQGAGKGKGSDNEKGVFLNKLFRKDAPDVDDLVTGLAGRGFRVETPQQLLEMLDVRLRTGNEVFGLPTQSMDDVPMAMRGRAVEEGVEDLTGGRTAGPAVPTANVQNIKQAVTAVHAQAVAQSEGFLRDVTDAAAQAGGRAVQEMFPKAVKALDRAVTKVERAPKVPSDLLRATVEAPAGGPAAAETTANQLIQAMAAKGYQIYAPGGKPDITDRHLDATPGYKDIALKFVKDADGPDPIVKEILVIQPAMLAAKKAIHGFYKQVREIDRQLKNETRPEVIAMLKQASAQAEAQMLQLAAQAYEADLAGVAANQARRLAIQASASVQSSADISSTSSGKSGGVGMPLSSTERGLTFMSSLSMQQQGSTPGRAGQAPQARPISTDPLTPPKVLRGSGPEVLPGTAAPRPGVARTTTTPRPDWVLQPGETGEGRRLIKGIENYKRGQKWGMRQIIDLVNRAVKLEMRASRSQTTRKHPANYRPANHVAFTRNTQSQINFHEAGHGLYELMEARVPGFWKRYEAELMPLVDREGSMASANNLHEAVAEWLRLLMVDPPAVADMAVTAVLADAAEQFYPRMAATLRDGARAVHRFQNKPAAVKWAMLNADPQQTPPSWGDFLTAALRSGTAATNFLSSGAPVFKLDRGIFRAIMADRKEVDLGWRDALKLAREIRKETASLQAAYNMVLSIGAETTSAMSGSGPMRGVRVMGPDGKYKQLTTESYRDLRLKVPASKLRQFDEAAWAKESLSRYEYFTERAIAARDAGDTAAMRVAMQQRQYPGMLEGLTTKDLAEIVSAARLDIPRFEEYFREQSAWFDAVLNVKEFGGLKKPGEVKAMMGARDTYWPLPKVMSAPRAARGRSSRGDIMAGDRGIQGSGEPIRAVDEVALERVRQAYDAYYWNRFGTIMVDRMQKVAADKRLPAEARIMAGQAAVRLTVPSEKVATLSAEEIVPWVLDAVATMMEGTLGFKPDLSPDDVRLSFNFKDVFRPGRPDDINVISLLRNGEREFYQLGDPGMFAMFASPQNASRTTALLRWALGPSLQNWKRLITQSLPFAFQNLFGDIFNQTMLNPDKVGWFPGGATVLGMMNKFSQKYPQVFQDGLLLSRVEPSATELLQQVRHNAVWQWMTEGFYVSTSKNPVTRVVQTALQPSNYLFPLWKLGDLINLITGGRALAPIFETMTREGAAVYKLMKGATDEEALAAYWQVSGRFNEHAGNADVRVLMQMPGFFNPMVQAFRGGMQNLTDPDPAVSGKTWVKLLTMYPAIFGGAAITTYLLMSEDEKERERERLLEDRLSYYTVGGMRIRFPYGPEGAMGSMVYNSIMDDLLGRPKTEATRGATLLLKRIVDPGGGPLQFFGPQLATITEANMNWSTFRQKHIVAPWMTAMPASEQYYSTTPEFYKKLGEMMNYSPIKLQYIVQQAISRQADETIRLVEAIDRGRPLMEDADIPFVGRMFIRNPTGMASQSVKDVSNVGERLRLLDSRLASKGWSMLRDPNFDTEKIADRKLVQLQTQLQYLELLRYGVNQMSKISEVGKVYRLQEDYANEANARTMMMRYAQSLLAGNTDQIATIDQALELLQEIPKAPPEQVAADYLQRRN